MLDIVVFCCQVADMSVTANWLLSPSSCSWPGPGGVPYTYILTFSQTQGDPCAGFWIFLYIALFL